MRILTDENIPRVITDRLREEGHDVLAIGEEMPGISDTMELRIAEDQQRLILTFDLDFGELVFRHQHPIPYGLVLFRIKLLLPDQLAEFVMQVLSSRGDWTRHYSVVDSNNIRMIELPLR